MVVPDVVATAKAERPIQEGNIMKTIFTLIAMLVVTGSFAYAKDDDGRELKCGPVGSMAEMQCLTNHGWYTHAMVPAPLAHTPHTRIIYYTPLRTFRKHHHYH
jgi:hypothetical protein